MTDPGQASGGWHRVLRATSNSLHGLGATFRGESAFRQELALALILMPLGLWLGRSGFERVVLLAALLLVLIVELLNTAIECTVDRIGPELHPLARRAKDAGSAAVLLSLALVVLVWGGVAWARFAPG